jgi:hypothetical protein
MTSLQQTAMGGGSTTAKTTSYVLVAADAGTVVQMNAAGATTITVNTALFAAGDSVQIQNIGAGVCTITAGTATVTTAGSLALSQWEGGNLYFTSTSASIFFDIVQTSGMTNPMTTTGDTIYSSSGSTPARLGIGTTGQVLTVASGLPSWATASSGALTLISTTNASAASSTVTFSSCFSATYRNYLVNVDGALSASSGFIQIQMRAGSTTQSTLYYGGRYQVGTSGSGYSVGQTSASSWEICDGSSNKFSIAANIMNPYVGKVQMNTRYWTRNGDTGGIQQGFIDTTTSYDSMVLAFSGTYTGTVSIYGYGI